VSNGTQLASKVDESPQNTPGHFNLPSCHTLLWRPSFSLNLGPRVQKGPGQVTESSPPYLRHTHIINKVQALKNELVSLPVLLLLKGKTCPVVLWRVNEAKVRQAKRNESLTAFMGQRCHRKSAQELQKQAVSTPCWKDWRARGLL